LQAMAIDHGHDVAKAQDFVEQALDCLQGATPAWRVGLRLMLLQVLVESRAFSSARTGVGREPGPEGITGTSANVYDRLANVVRLAMEEIGAFKKQANSARSMRHFVCCAEHLIHAVRVHMTSRNEVDISSLACHVSLSCNLAELFLLCGQAARAESRLAHCASPRCTVRHATYCSCGSEPAWRTACLCGGRTRWVSF
jgi:hypothetical protein